MLRFFCMKKVDYIIVGGGYAGLFFAHQLIRNNKSFILFSKPQESASQVSAGIINPAILKKFTTFWKAAEQIEYLNTVAEEIAAYMGHNYIIRENIRRIFHDENEKALWLKKAETEELQPFLSKETEPLDVVKNPFGSGRVMQSARWDVQRFFTDFYEYLDAKGNLCHEAFNHDQLKDHIYSKLKYQHIVFCEGTAVHDNPYFSSLPVYPNKGHHLIVRLSKPLPFDYTVKKKHFLFPIGNGTYYYGGTYDREGSGAEVDETAVAQLTNGLAEFYPYPFTVEEVHLGYRPTVKDRRPILGRHHSIANRYVFNGLGARGILNGSWFSRELFDLIETGKPVSPEVDLRRFDNN